MIEKAARAIYEELMADGSRPMPPWDEADITTRASILTDVEMMAPFVAEHLFPTFSTEGREEPEVRAIHHRVRVHREVEPRHWTWTTVDAYEFPDNAIEEIGLMQSDALAAAEQRGREQAKAEIRAAIKDLYKSDTDGPHCRPWNDVLNYVSALACLDEKESGA